jgi:hypothetical protein
LQCNETRFSAKTFTEAFCIENIVYYIFHITKKAKGHNKVKCSLYIPYKKKTTKGHNKVKNDQITKPPRYA